MFNFFDESVQFFALCIQKTFLFLTDYEPLPNISILDIIVCLMVIALIGNYFIPKSKM